MSARDELAEVIAWQYHAFTPHPTVLYGAVADTILAAGYRKPRTVSTAEELGALPSGSIIRDSQGCAWQKYNRPISDKPAWFSATRNDGFYFSSNFVDGNRMPATVLFEGGATS